MTCLPVKLLGTAVILAFGACAHAQTAPALTYYNFGGVAGNGLQPSGTAVIGIGSGGRPVLYGTAYRGASTNCFDGCGTVFSVVPPASQGGAWTETILYAFLAGDDGGNPEGGVTLAPDGTLYGATFAGGPGTCGTYPTTNGCGTVFSLMPPVSAGGAWQETILTSFLGGSDGIGPASTVTIGGDGALYGTTAYGGAGACSVPGEPAGCGTVYSLTPPKSPGGSWTRAVLYTFQDATDGTVPNGLTLGTGGVLYGTTTGGGTGTCTNIFQPPGCGTMYALIPPPSSGGAWTKAILYNFQGSRDGANPVSGVAVGEGGVLFGTTSKGGVAPNCERQDEGCGTVYSLTPPASSSGAWSETVLHRFQRSDGFSPEAGVTIGPGGVLYGTTYEGGTGPFGKNGTVYAVRPPSSAGGAWTEVTIYDFTCCGPYLPTGGVVLAGGTLYGTTSMGGTSNGGTAFALEP